MSVRLSAVAYIADRSRGSFLKGAIIRDAHGLVYPQDRVPVCLTDWHWPYGRAEGEQQADSEKDRHHGRRNVERLACRSMLCIMSRPVGRAQLAVWSLAGFT